ncbi:MAG: hypothetical protein H6744_14050 [Deltaproteobacteria bacterium]|nr:hypothetical protein [Deltaproteobacteria bacterium]MCB9787801.1 hypothetical protein [Deltaproteobacteria bacterium]
MNALHALGPVAETRAAIDELHAFYERFESAILDADVERVTELVGAREEAIDRLRRAVAQSPPAQGESESIREREHRLQERMVAFRDELRGNLGQMSARARALRRYAQR